jgi:hypothetical protein
MGSLVAIIIIIILYAQLYAYNCMIIPVLWNPYAYTTRTCIQLYAYLAGTAAGSNFSDVTVMQQLYAYAYGCSAGPQLQCLPVSVICIQL